MRVVEVFADVACPFTHVGLRRISAYRRERGTMEPMLRLRAWPLELVNGESLQGPALAPKIAALRAEVAPDLFVGFDGPRFPRTTLPALATEAAAYRQGVEVGEAFSLAVRTALFERGLDVSAPDVLRALRHEHGVPPPDDADESAVRADFDEGTRRGVAGSPHFFTARGDFFCPSLAIERQDGRLEVSFDAEGFQEFISAAFE
jgi:predicted DsbA family dithiol-disulfide isomerase